MFLFSAYKENWEAAKPTMFTSSESDSSTQSNWDTSNAMWTAASGISRVDPSNSNELLSEYAEYVDSGNKSPDDGTCEEP